MKKSKSHSFFLLLLGLMFFLQGCDPRTTYETYIDNRSADTLILHFSPNDSIRFETSEITVMPGELSQIYLFDRIGKDKSYVCEVLDSTTTISTPSGKLVTKNAYDLANWTSIYANDLLRWQCYFQVKDADIQ